MASPFTRAMRAADRTVARTFGEAVRLTPRTKSPEKGYRVDPARPARTLRATFTLAPAADRLQGVRKGTEFNGMTTLAVAQAQLWIAETDLAALGYELRADDAVALLDRPGGPSYSIVKVLPTDQGDRVLHLVAETGP